MIDSLIVIGLQRSGTTYFTHLCKINYGVKIFKEGDCSMVFKHTLPEEDHVIMYKTKKRIDYNMPAIEKLEKFKNLLVVVIRKELNQWLKSISRFEADLEQKRPELYTGGSLDLEKASSFWNHFYESWEKIDILPNFEIIDYSDMLYDHSYHILRLADKYGLERKQFFVKDKNRVPFSSKFTLKKRLAALNELENKRGIGQILDLKKKKYYFYLKDLKK